MKYIALLLLMLSAGCCSDAGPIKAEPQTPPVKVRLLYTDNVQIFKTWTEIKIQEWCLKYDIKEMPAVFLLYGPMIESIIDEKMTYRLGEFYGDANTIVIYLVSPNHIELPLEEMKLVLAHEFIHAYLHAKGLPQPEGEHNELFQAKITEMGLLK